MMVMEIREQRLKWVGNILRMSPDRPVYRAVSHAVQQMHTTRPQTTKRHGIATRGYEYITHTK